MKYVFDDLVNIKRYLGNNDIVLLLDFDLTLSPLVMNPKNAVLPQSTRTILEKVSRVVPTVVITGRTIQDVKKRINIPGIMYLGNHGLEYEIKGVTKNINIPALPMGGLKKIKKELLKLKRKYSGVLVEDKNFTLALHYRLISSKNQPLLLLDIRTVENNLKKYNLRGVLYKRTFEVRPDIKENKGTSSLFAIKKLGNPRKVIYIGDGKTDEDAFRALPNGITIKVGKANRSAAKYYLHNVSEVRKFLFWLLSLRD